MVGVFIVALAVVGLRASANQGESGSVGIIEETGVQAPEQGGFCQNINCDNSTICSKINEECTICGHDKRCYSDSTVCKARCQKDSECGGSCPQCKSSVCSPDTAVCQNIKCDSDESCSKVNKECTICGYDKRCFSRNGICQARCSNRTECGGGAPGGSACPRCHAGLCHPNKIPPASPSPAPEPSPAATCANIICTSDLDCISAGGYPDCQFCLQESAKGGGKGCFNWNGICGKGCKGPSDCGGQCPICKFGKCRYEVAPGGPAGTPRPYPEAPPPSPYSEPGQCSGHSCTYDSECQTKSGHFDCAFCRNNRCFLGALCNTKCTTDKDCGAKSSSAECPICTKAGVCGPDLSPKPPPQLGPYHHPRHPYTPAGEALTNAPVLSEAEDDYYYKQL